MKIMAKENDINDISNVVYIVFFGHDFHSNKSLLLIKFFLTWEGDESLAVAFLLELAVLLLRRRPSPSCGEADNALCKDEAKSCECLLLLLPGELPVAAAAVADELNLRCEEGVLDVLAFAGALADFDDHDVVVVGDDDDDDDTSATGNQNFFCLFVAQSLVPFKQLAQFFSTSYCDDKDVMRKGNATPSANYLTKTLLKS